MSFIRKPNRLPYKNLYQGGNWYFVTLCIQNRKCILSSVEAMPPSPNTQTTSPNVTPSPNIITFPSTNSELLKLSTIGKCVKKAWLDNQKFYKSVILDEYIIMPNHFHGIIGFDKAAETDIGTIIKGFKRKSITYIKQNLNDVGNGSINGDGGIASTESRMDGVGGFMNGDGGIASTVYLVERYKTIWQKSFYDRIIRDEKDFQRIREYIYNNPTQWEFDILNPKNEDNYQKWLIKK
jgi:REP element-mobilizing transposase RayT